MFPFATLHLLETFATFESMATFKTLPAFPALTTFRAIVTTFPHFATFDTGEVKHSDKSKTELTNYSLLQTVEENKNYFTVLQLTNVLL